MSFEPDSETFEQKMLMLVRELLEQQKLTNLILEEVHNTGLSIDDIEEET